MSDNGDKNAPEAEPKPEEKTANPPIEIKVKDQNGNETFFKIKSATKLCKVFDAYCDRQSLDRRAMRFFFDGTRIQEDDTPSKLEMEGGDMIDAMLEQTGGAAEDGNGESSGQEKPERMTIKVKEQNGDGMEFKCKSSTPLSKLMDAYCNSQGRDNDSLRFFTPDGKRVNRDDTPGSLNLEDGDLLDCHEEQQGGS